MMKLKMLALVGVVAVLSMAGCGKKKHHREMRQERGMHMKKNARAKKHVKNNKAKRHMRRAERDMFAK